MEHIETTGVRVAVDPVGGLLTHLVITSGGRTIRPLHSAPWVEAPDDVPPDAPPHLARLAGDFFCAPFGRQDDGTTPSHGWAANGRWTVEERGGSVEAPRVTFRLDNTVAGATLHKTVTLRAGHPVVYQTHRFTGGAGAVPVAHHAMVHVPGGAALSFSPKLFGATPGTPLEGDPARGRSILAYPQRFTDLSSLRCADGRSVDARRYPFTQGHEDFLTLFDPPDATVGWSAAVAAADGFLFFALKDARALPQTSLWLSNGGRSYAPWRSRHTAVLGIEECCTHFGDGTRVSAEPNALSAEGLRTALPLQPDGEVVVRYALGAVPAEPDWGAVTDIALEPGFAVIRLDDGPTLRVPFDDAFLR